LDEPGPRIVPAATATFAPASSILSVLGDGADNTVTVSRDAVGTILIDGGAAAVSGGNATVANTILIQVYGQGGNGTGSLDKASAALPAANLFGGVGNDALTAGSGNDQRCGQAGNDTLFGGNGDDVLIGGPGQDLQNAVPGDDTVFQRSGMRAGSWTIPPLAPRQPGQATGTLPDLSHTFLSPSRRPRRAPRSCWVGFPRGGAHLFLFLLWRVHPVVLSWIQCLLKKSRPVSRSAQQRRLTLGALEDRTVPSFTPAVTFPVGVLPRTVTVADFNNDGKPDLAVLNVGPSSASQSSLSVLLGNGDGSFQPAITTPILNGGVAGGNAHSVAVGDFNGDGKLDVALNTSGTPANPAVEVLLGNGDGSFQANHLSLGVGQTPLSVAAGDFDHNGTLDLVTANSNGTVSVLLNNGGGSFRPRVDLAVGGAPVTVAVGDFNGDGKLDVVTAQQLTDSVSVLLGNGDGTFARPLVFAASGQNFTPQSMALGDVNGDGKIDLVIKSVSFLDSDAFQVGVLLGNGDGTFQAPFLAPAQPDGSGDLALGDFNGDGRMDVAVADQLGASTGDLSVFFGNGDGTVQPFLRLDLSTGGNDPLGVAAADLNGDGLVDLVAANASSSNVGVLLNTSTAPAPAPAGTTTTLSTSTPTPVSGQTGFLTATVNSNAGVPTGTITFLDGTTVLGTARLNNAGQATIKVFLGVGNHVLTASFAGNGGFADSTSAAVTETVNRASTTVALGSSVNPAVTGQAVTFTATVAVVAPGAGVPTGTVTFQDGNVVLGTAAVGRDGTATFTTSFAAAGGHVITAVYNGDVNFVAGSQTLTEQVNALSTHKATTTTLSASANPVRVGRAVTFTATVRDPSGTGTPTGTVTFFVGSTVVARVTLDTNGQAHFTRVFMVRGPFVIRAAYSGDNNFDASSKSLAEQVN
jgi:Bacterial Ig-like domain (group 3)/FG-GAP-like repeat/RTX calcium-binding nonapeptide repeat (4 copies)